MQATDDAGSFDCGVIFDLDGVLIDSEPVQYAAYAEVLAEFGVEVDPETYAREWIATGTGPEYAVERFGLSLSVEDLKARKEKAYRRLAPKIQVMPGAVEALERLAPHFPLALATNSKAVDVEPVLCRFDLRRHLSVVVTREDYRLPKPAPDAFGAAADALGCQPARCLVVEDAERGVRAAQALGMPVLALTNVWSRGQALSSAVPLVASLDELTPERVEQELASADLRRSP